MTDLERAQWAIRGEPETWVNMIVMHLAAARREGAAEMRERAARALDEDAPWAARAIRALPLTPEEPA